MACSRSRRSLIRLAFACLAFGVLGCAPPVCDVSGTIKVNGATPNMTGLNIAFLAADGRLGTVDIKPDGTYESAKPVPAGDVKVYFDYTPGGAGTGGKRPPLSQPAGKDAPPPKTTTLDLSKNPVPQRLRNPDTTTLTTTLNAGRKNTFDYDMKP